ncbi:MAG: hypothetical protein HY040_29075 [Planctomycetes bacterium]|nr:hypothetical protein [Planctomycetota bacterium]
MTLPAPDWLIQHGGNVRLGSDGSTWFVFFGAAAEYALNAVPIGVRFGCTIRQTNNGKRLDNDLVIDDSDEALRGGLEQLGKTLGWK